MFPAPPRAYFVARRSDGVFLRQVGAERAHDPETEVVIECDPLDPPDLVTERWDGETGWRPITAQELAAADAAWRNRVADIAFTPGIPVPSLNPNLLKQSTAAIVAQVHARLLAICQAAEIPPSTVGTYEEFLAAIKAEFRTRLNAMTARQASEERER
jgi:hypothetical protein